MRERDEATKPEDHMVNTGLTLWEEIKMTSRPIKGASLAMCLAAAATMMAGTAATAEDVTIRASSWHPPKHPGVAQGYEPFMKYVEENSDGTMNFQFWSGGALLGATDTLPGVENGIADIGVLALTYFPAEFPHAQLISDMAMMSSDAAAITGAVTELVVLHCPPCLKDFTDKGILFTSTYSTTPYELISKEPITSVEDLRGKKFRSGGPLWDRWVQDVGGTSITVPASEMFESLDRGGVDVVIFSPSALQSFSLWDVAKNTLELPLGTYAAMSTFTINQGFWRGLTEDQRRTILDGVAVGAMGTTYGYMEQDQQAVDQAAEHGVTLSEPGADLIAQRDAFRDADLEKLAAGAEANYGIADAAGIIETYTGLVGKWETISREAEGDQQKMIEAMRTEIFDKVDVSTFGL